MKIHNLPRRLLAIGSAMASSLLFKSAINDLRYKNNLRNQLNRSFNDREITFIKNAIVCGGNEAISMAVDAGLTLEEATDLGNKISYKFRNMPDRSRLHVDKFIK